MNKYISRITSSARGEIFNPLTWPFLFATFAYGICFALFSGTAGVGESSLFQAMTSTDASIPFIWGWLAIANIVAGFTFLLYNIPPAGKLSGLVGFMLWLYAGFCWLHDGGWPLIFAIGIPNMWFWIWQYLSLSVFRHEEADDLATMQDYDAGGYDDELNPKDSAIAREDNRGVDTQ